MLCIKSTIYLTGQANNNTRRKRLRCALNRFGIWNLMFEICDLIDFWCWKVMILNNT